jgi:hypothetical protein
LLIGSLLCLSCDGAAIDVSQSLVGARELPSANALLLEGLYISRGGGDGGGDRLSYDWRPDNSLLVVHEFSDGKGSSVIRGRETLRFSPEIAGQARRLLWRIRPAELEGMEQDARPNGCKRRGPHDFGEVSVAFVKEGDDAARTEDDQVGLFALPTVESCNTPAAAEARAVVGRALQLLPDSKVAAAFKRTT